MTANRIEVFRGKDGWRVRLRAKNGRKLLTSEMYAKRFNAHRAAGNLSKAIGWPIKVIH